MIFNPDQAGRAAHVYCEINFPQLPTLTADERVCLGFRAPLAIHAAHRVDEVLAVMQAVEAASARGHWCVGFVSHEAAPAFDRALITLAPGQAPLAWFAEFSASQPVRETDGGNKDFTVGNWRRDTTSPAFAAAVESIRTDIADGRFYQVNYTTRMHADFSGDPLAFYRALQLAQPNGYQVYIDAGDFYLLSVSPELFFSMRRDHKPDGEPATIITTQPMKGTAPRGDSADEDAAIAETLTHSPKERAENLMIVDLLRNDLSRIAQPNSVEVPHLFSLHPLPSVWQMTSTVRATLQNGRTLTDVFAALFPCGSVTGAPKVEAMKAIGELETSPRGAYCGAIGYVSPNQTGACFNVGIRSVWIQDHHATCGVGSGITFDSTVDGEAAELVYKTRFVERASKTFALFETIRLADGEYALLDRHLTRMAHSARHFRFNFSIETARSSLNALKSQFPQGVWRVRLTAHDDGRCDAMAAALDVVPTDPVFQLAAQPVSRHDEFLVHKTTRREVYDQHAPSAGVWDTLLWNEQGELTEFIRANLVLDIDGRRFTPPLDCGLLNGTMRAALLDAGAIEARILRAGDLARAQKIWWVNGLRGEVLVRERAQFPQNAETSMAMPAPTTTISITK